MKSQLNWRKFFVLVNAMVFSTVAHSQNGPSYTAPQYRALNQQIRPSDQTASSRRSTLEPTIRRFDYLDDVELVGRNYAMSKPGEFVPYDTCKKACLKSKTCQGFTHFADGRCHLKESISTQRKAPGMRSALLSKLRFKAATNQIDLGRIGDGKTTAPPTKQAKPVKKIAEICGRGYYAYPSQEFQGFNLTLASNLVTLEGCRRLCNSNSRCKGFSWHGRPGSNRPAKCWMKRRITKPISRSNRLACEKSS